MVGRDMKIVSMTAGWLDGFGLRFNKRSRRDDNLACANMVWARSERIQGILYELESIEEIIKLDPHEGSPWRYSRELFNVQTSGAVQPAWIYVANPAVLDDTVLPGRWYIEHLLAGRDYLTEDYWQRINNTECLANSVEGSALIILNVWLTRWSGLEQTGSSAGRYYCPVRPAVFGLPQYQVNLWRRGACLSTCRYA